MKAIQEERLARIVGDPLNYYNHVNEFTAIPDKFLIPMNIKATEQNIKFISEFMRLNEIYVGNKTTYKEQQSDNKNWICRLDTGLNDSYLSTKNIYPYVNDDATTYIKGTMDSSANFSFFGNWYPNLISQWNNKNRSDDMAGTFNKFYPLQIYPINSKSSMGSDKHSNYHYLWVYSRFDETVYNDVKTSNIDMTLSTHSPGGALEQTTTYALAGLKMEQDSNFKLLCQKYNVNLRAINYHGIDDLGIGFINKYDTAGGTGDNLVVAEATLTVANYYGPFRICCGCNLGFDPSGIINPFIVPVNTDQTNNENTDVRRWKLNAYEPDDNNHAKYSSYIEDYVNYVFVGTTNPQINFNSDGRFEIVNLHTPRLFSQGDSKTGVSVGSQVAIFNEKNQMFNVLRVFSDNPTTDPDLVKTESQNFGIADAICGIGIIGLSVKNENNEILESGFDNFFINTVNYDGCLFDRLGFRLNQFLFTYGSQESRMNLFFQNDVNENRRNYCSFFTTEGFLNQSINQLINIYSSNQPDNVTGVDAVNLRGLPQYQNGYVGLSQYALNVESFKVRALSLPARLVNSYYHIVTTLPTTSYIANNNFLNVGCYVFKQYRTGNFFFSYSSDMIATATEDFVLSNIHTEIRNQNGTLAQNLGANNTIFYKITSPQTINQPNIPEPLSRTEEQLIRLNSNIKDLESITLNKNKKLIIGQNAQTILNQIQEQNQILNSAYDAPIPIQPIANQFNIIPNTNPRFQITNPTTGAQIISVSQPQSPLKQPEFNILETGQTQVVLPPVMIDDMTMTEARLIREAETQTLETKTAEESGDLNVDIFNKMDVIKAASSEKAVQTVDIDGQPVVINVDEPSTSTLLSDLQAIQSGKKKVKPFFELPERPVSPELNIVGESPRSSSEEFVDRTALFASPKKTSPEEEFEVEEMDLEDLEAIYSGSSQPAEFLKTRAPGGVALPKGFFKKESVQGRYEFLNNKINSGFETYSLQEFNEYNRLKQVVAHGNGNMKIERYNKLRLQYEGSIAGIEQQLQQEMTGINRLVLEQLQESFERFMITGEKPLTEAQVRKQVREQIQAEEMSGGAAAAVSATPARGSLPTEIYSKQAEQYEAERLIAKYEKELDKLKLDEGDKSYRDFLRETGRTVKGRIPKYTVSDRITLLNDYVQELETIVLSGGEIPSLESFEQSLIESGAIEQLGGVRQTARPPLKVELGPAAIVTGGKEPPVVEVSKPPIESGAAPVMKGRPKVETEDPGRGEETA